MIDLLEPRALCAVSLAGPYALGINYNDEAATDRHFAYTVAEMRKLGVTAVRLYLTIDGYDNRPNAWDPDQLPGAIGMDGRPLPSGQGNVLKRAFQLKHLGFHVLLTVEPERGDLPASAGEVTDYFSHLVNIPQSPTGTERLRDVVDVWEIGNEPDVQSYWADPSSDKTTRLKSYVDKLLLPAAAVLHSGAPGTWEKIVSGGVSYSPDDMKTILSYLKSSNQLAAIDYAGIHPYGAFNPDVPSSNVQAGLITRARGYADAFGKKMIATEWSVRGYANTGSDDARYARALDLNYRNYILPNFAESYYFTLVNNWVGRGGSVSARPAGVLKHESTAGVNITLHPDLLADYYASKLVESQPFFSTFQSWTGITPAAPLFNRASVDGSAWWDDNSDGVVQDNERIAPSQALYLDLNRNNRRDAGEPQTRTDELGNFRLALPAGLTGTAPIRMITPYPQTTTITVSLSQKTTQFVGVCVGARPDFAPPARIKGSITGVLFNDANRNNLKESTETVAAGRLVYLDLNRNGIRDASDYTVLTDASGVFIFRTLSAGTYVLRAVSVKGDSAVAKSITIATDQRLLNQTLALRSAS